MQFKSNSKVEFYNELSNRILKIILKLKFKNVFLNRNLKVISNRNLKCISNSKTKRNFKIEIKKRTLKSNCIDNFKNWI